MISTDTVIIAQNDVNYRSKLISQYSGFILKHASAASGRYVSQSDDIYSVALIAFNDAIISFNTERGEFEPFAAKVIRNRVIDFLRKENNHNQTIPLSALSKYDDHGDIVEFEIEDKNSALNDTALEITSLKQELQKFGIDFFDIAKSSPKSRKTISACLNAAHYIAGNKNLLLNMYEKKTLPVKALIEDLKVGKKIPDRYRKYIIMSVLILDGEYELLRDHLENGRKVCG